MREWRLGAFGKVYLTHKRGAKSILLSSSLWMLLERKCPVELWQPRDHEGTGLKAKANGLRMEGQKDGNSLNPEDATELPT